MEYNDGRDKRDSGDGIESESHMLKVDCVVRLVAGAEDDDDDQDDHDVDDDNYDGYRA